MCLVFLIWAASWMKPPPCVRLTILIQLFVSSSCSFLSFLLFLSSSLVILCFLCLLVLAFVLLSLPFLVRVEFVSHFFLFSLSCHSFSCCCSFFCSWSAWGQSGFCRTYGLYLEEKLVSYHNLGESVERRPLNSKPPFLMEEKAGLLFNPFFFLGLPLLLFFPLSPFSQSLACVGFLVRHTASSRLFSSFLFFSFSQEMMDLLSMMHQWGHENTERNEISLDRQITESVKDQVEVDQCPGETVQRCAHRVFVYGRSSFYIMSFLSFLLSSFLLVPSTLLFLLVFLFLFLPGLLSSQEQPHQPILCLMLQNDCKHSLRNCWIVK